RLIAVGIKHIVGNAAVLLQRPPRVAPGIRMAIVVSYRAHGHRAAHPGRTAITTRVWDFRPLVGNGPAGGQRDAGHVAEGIIVKRPMVAVRHDYASEIEAITLEKAVQLSQG